MTDIPNEGFVDLEIRVFPRREAGYPVEVILDGEQHFPGGYLPAGVLSWVPSGDPVVAKMFEVELTLLKQSSIRGGKA